MFRKHSDIFTMAAGGFFLVLLLIPVSIEDTGRVFHAWWDFGHVPAFTFISWGLLTLFRLQKLFRIRLPAVWIMALLFVPGVEFLQGFVGRQQDVSDLIYGSIGCLVGGLMFIGNGNRFSQPRLTQSLAAVLAMGAMVYPVRLWMEDLRVERMYPVLSAFDTPLEATRWNVIGCDVLLKKGWNITIRDDAKYAAIISKEIPRDWSSTTGLGVDIFLEGNEPSDMSVVVDDTSFFPDYYNRFQKKVILKPGTNSVIFERQILSVTNGGRPMNMNNICALGLYFNQKHAGRVLHLTRVYLIGDES